MPYDHVKDFVPIVLVAGVPNVLVVHPSVPANSVQELIAYGKANPGKLNFASSGAGTSIHLAGELFKVSTGVQMQHVPYKGSAPALIDLLGGQLAFMFDTINTSQQHIKAGKLRALGVGTTKRSTLMPDVAPIADTLTGFEAATWVGLLAPAGTPKEIVNRMQQEIAKVVRSPEVREKLSASGAEPVANTPEQFGAYLAAEVAKWERVVKQAKIPPVQ